MWLAVLPETLTYRPPTGWFKELATNTASVYTRLDTDTFFNKDVPSYLPTPIFDELVDERGD